MLWIATSVTVAASSRRGSPRWLPEPAGVGSVCCLDVGGDLPAEGGARIEHPQQQHRVGHRRGQAAAPITCRPRILPALAGPTLMPPAGSREAMLPPPAPMLLISSTGTLAIRSCSSSSSRVVEARPSATATSVLVPPMSKATRFGMPRSRE